ncbi:MAG TPA: hypothetical protein VK858_07780, partial [Longimicrobiales bacterium]|nr:hypothetical protein [Longimicrobiales bacterium]
MRRTLPAPLPPAPPRAARRAGPLLAAALVLSLADTYEAQDAAGWSVGITAFAGVQAGSTPRRTLDLPGTSERRVWGVAGLELDAAFGPFR